MKRETVNIKFLSILLTTIIFPVFLVFQTFNFKEERLKRWALTLFVTIYGSTIFLTQANDGFRHQQKVYDHYTGLSFNEWFIELIDILSFRVTISGTQDVYKHVISYLVASIGLPGLFFTIVAFVYGYFFSGSLILIFRNFWNTKKSYLFWGFVLLFLLIKNIEGVNTVRTWTGMWILVYACLKYYETKRLKYLLLMFVPPFIHMGYFIMAIPAYLFLLFGNREKIFALMFVLSSFMNMINPTDVTSQVSETELGQKKLRGYYVENRLDVQSNLEYFQEIRANSTWYYRLYRGGIQKWAMNVFIYTILLTGVYFTKMNKYQRSIFSIGLLMLTLSNSVWFLSAVSNRSYIIGMIFIFSGFIVAYLNPKTKQLIFRKSRILNVGLFTSFILFIPYFIYNLSDVFQYPSVFLIFAPYLVWIDESINISIKEFVKLIF